MSQGGTNISTPPHASGVTATLNVRVAPSTRSIVDLATKVLGLSVREVVESAVLEKYSAEFLSRNATVSPGLTQGTLVGSERTGNPVGAYRSATANALLAEHPATEFAA